MPLSECKPLSTHRLSPVGNVPFVMRMYNIHSPVTIVAADRHYARHHRPVMAVYRQQSLRQSPCHQDRDSPSGSFGTVYFRILGETETLVAVKEPFLNSEAMMCFFNEVRMVEMLPYSINVVRTLGLVHKSAGDPPSALVMTMYTGTFHSFLATGGRSYSGTYTMQETVDMRSGSKSLQSFGYIKLLLHLLAGIANGLAHLHACGIVHNDLSESNVFVEHPSADKSSFALPEAVVGDMGRATREEACGEILYGCSWLAKRTVHETRLSAASDVFSLGTILLSALCGAAQNVHCIPDLALVEPSCFIVNSRPELAPWQVRHIISELRSIIRVCTDRLPVNRPTAVCVRDRLRHMSMSTSMSMSSVR